MKKSVILTLSATALAVTVCTICAYASINVPKNDSEKTDGNVRQVNAVADGENSIVSRDLPGEISSAAILGKIEDDPASKENIFISMLNSVDFFDTVQGEFVTTFLDSERKETRVTYAVDVPNIRSYSKTTGARNTEMYYDGDYIYNVLTDKREYRTDRYCPQYTAQSRHAGKQDIYEAHSAPAKISGRSDYSYSDRTGVGEDGYNYYRYRSDLTYAHYAETSIMSQEVVFGFLSHLDSWDVSGVDTYLGRQAITIKGKTNDADYASKLKVYDFVMVVDAKTGILLDFEGYDEDGNVTQYLHTERISVNEDMSALDGQIKSGVASVKANYAGNVTAIN